MSKNRSLGQTQDCNQLKDLLKKLGQIGPSRFFARKNFIFRKKLSVR